MPAEPSDKRRPKLTHFYDIMSDIDKELSDCYLDYYSDVLLPGLVDDDISVDGEAILEATFGQHQVMGPLSLDTDYSPTVMGSQCCEVVPMTDEEPGNGWPDHALTPVPDTDYEEALEMDVGPPYSAI